MESKLNTPKISGLPRKIGNSGRSTPVRASRESLVSNPPEDPRSILLLDNWIIGDVCYVNGVKLGKVAFLGETRFAPGQWAGVALELPEGKNDGQVAGHRYFQCTANHGIFCRVSKLTREPNADNLDGTLTGLQPNAQSTPKQDNDPPYLMERESVEREYSLMQGSMGSPGANDVTLNPNSLEMGDRVVVSGTKHGIIRFLGETDFAAGFWAGVELETPLGKNDGSVQNKRYFACKPRFGLFAPASKVDKSGPTPSSNRKLMPVRHTKTSQMRLHRSGSQESLSSMSSFTSFASTSTAARLKHRSRAPAPVSKSGSGPNATAMGVLQESIKEKEHHVEQLLKEREMERAEMGKASQQCEIAEQRLAEYKRQSENEKSELTARVKHMEDTLRESQTEITQLTDNLDEEKRKSEDLQFQLEEIEIMKVDLQTRVSELESGSDASTDAKSEPDSGRVLQLEKHLTELKSKCESQEKSVKDGRHLESELRQKILELESNQQNGSKTIETQIANLTAELQQAQSNAIEKQNTIESLTKEVQNLIEEEILVKENTLKLEEKLTNVQSDTNILNEAMAKRENDNISLREEKTKLESDLAQASGATSNQIDVLEAKNKEIENTKKIISQLEESLKSKDEESKKGKEEMQKNVGDLETQIMNADIHREKLQQQLNEAMQNCNKISSEMVEEREKYEGLGETQIKEIGDLKEDLTNVKESLLKTETELSTFKQGVDNLETEKEKMCAEIEGLKVAQEMAASSLGIKLTDEKEKLESQCTELQSQIAVLQSQITENSQLAETQKLENSSLSSEKLRMQEEIQVKTKENEDLKKELEKSADKSKMSIEGLKCERQELSDEVARFKDQSSNEEKKIDQLQNELKTTEEKIKQSEECCEKLRKDIVLNDTNVNNLKEQNASLSAQIESMKQAQTLDTNSQIKQIGEEKNRLADELKSAQERLADQQTQITSESLEKESLQKVKDQLEIDLTKMNNENTEQSKQIDDMKLGLDGVKTECDIVKNDRQKLQGVIDVKDKEMGEMMAAMEKAEQQFVDERQKMQNENGQLNEQLKNVETAMEAVLKDKSQLEINNKERDTKSNEINQEKSQLADKIEEMKQSLENAAKENNALEQQFTEVKTCKAAADQKLVELEEELNKVRKDIIVGETQRKEDVGKLEAQVVQHDNKRKQLSEEHNTNVTRFKDTLEQMQSSLDSVTKERDSLKQQITEQTSAVSQASDARVNALQKHINELKNNWETSKDFQNQLKLSECTVAEVKQLVVLKDSENAKLKSEMEKLQNVINKLHDVETANAKLQLELNDARKSETELNDNFAFERSKYEQKMKEISDQLSASQSKLQASNVKDTTDDIIQREVVEKLQTEKDKLEQKIIALESKQVTSEPKLEVQTGTSGVREHELEMQVSFLNSVIVDQRRKQEEMQQKIEVLMRSPFDSSGAGIVKKVAAPREYCDICEEFDVHDTDDCPTQASDTIDKLDHSAHHARDKPQREYCDNCEQFGHASAHCDNQMF